MKRIICVGNRFHAQDAAGPAVYDRLASHSIPDDVEVIDGGLAGLDLLRFVEDAERVVFVDAVIGLSGTVGVVILDRADACRYAAAAAYGHAAGLTYLLQALPHVCEGAIPEVHLVGIEGDADDETIRVAAELSVSVAVDGVSHTTPTATRLAGVTS